MQKTVLDELLQTEHEHMQKLNEIVQKAIDEEKLLSKRIYELGDNNKSISNKIADGIASFGGSWMFIVSFVVFISAWIVLNAYYLKHVFDPYPYILLNLILSTVAALQAPIIMMSQNRKEEKDRKRAMSDYMINLKAEIEVRNVHQKLDLLMSEQLKTLFDIQKTQIDEMEEIKDLLTKLDR